MNKENYIEKYGEDAYQKKLESNRKWHRKNAGYCKQATYEWFEKNHDKWNNYSKKWHRANTVMFNYCLPSEIELIENYEAALADNFETWTIHHRAETHDEAGNLLDKPVSRAQLIEEGLYYGRPACELIFLKRSDHGKIHGQFRAGEFAR